MESGLCFRPQLSVLFENDGGLPVVVVVVVVVMRGPLLVLLPYRLDSNATLCCPVGAQLGIWATFQPYRQEVGFLPPTTGTASAKN